MNYNLFPSSMSTLCFSCPLPIFSHGTKLLSMSKMLQLLFSLSVMHFPHFFLTLLILKISAQIISRFFFSAHLSKFKCGLSVYLMSSHDESSLLSLQYLITACLFLCIFHWRVASKRAGAISLVHMVSPAPESKLGTYWMVHNDYRLVLGWMEKPKNHSWKSF